MANIIKEAAFSAGSERRVKGWELDQPTPYGLKGDAPKWMKQFAAATTVKKGASSKPVMEDVQSSVEASGGKNSRSSLLL